MAEPRNTRSVADLFSGFDTTLRHYLIDRPRAYFHLIRGRFKNLPETNFKLGCDFAERGQWMDAVFRFRFVIYLRPDYAQAHYNLGCCYMQLNQPAKAAKAFVRTLQIEPNHTEARFMLSGLEPERMRADALPRHMPTPMVIGFFTQIAPQYDALAVRNEYQGPQLVIDASKPHLSKSEGLHLIELGCGTGLVTRPWRGICRETLGVDITPAMVSASEVARAGEVAVFNRVLKADINAIPAGTFMPGASDAVLCIDTAQFLGDLALAAKTAAAALNKGGLFVVSVEPYEAPHGFGVNPTTGRFGHTVDYVKSVAEAAGLTLKKDGRVPLYAGMAAHLFVFAKAAP